VNVVQSALYVVALACRLFLFKGDKNEFNQKDRKNGRVPLFHVFCNFDHCKFVWSLCIRGCPATVNHIMAHECNFVSFCNQSILSCVFSFGGLVFVRVIETVNKNIALLFLLLNLGGFAIWCFSTLNLFASLLLLSGADYLKVFQPDQLQAQAKLFINLRKNGAIIAQIPYGIWLFPLGYLVFKSGFLPKILGILLIVDCFGLLICVFQFFLLPGYEVISYPFMAVSFIAELSLTLCF